MEVIDKLRGHTSGLAIPHFVIDAPGGGGKIPLLPKYVLHQDDERIIMRNYKNDIYVYRNVNDELSKSKVEIEVVNNKKNGHSKIKEPKNLKNIQKIEVEEITN